MSDKGPGTQIQLVPNTVFQCGNHSVKILEYPDKVNHTAKHLLKTLEQRNATISLNAI